MGAKDSMDTAGMGLIVVDHGSRKPAANAQLAAVAALVKEQLGYRVVEPAHMEFAGPTVAEAFGACVAHGARLVVVHPFMLLEGLHSRETIPELVRAAAEKFPGVEYRITEPLGVDALLVGIIGKRVEAALAAREKK